MARATLVLLSLLPVAGCEYVTAPAQELPPPPFTLAGPSACGEGYIVYAAGALFRIRADGSEEPVQLTDGVETDSSPRWSPDGSQIAFLRAGALRIMDADGGDSAVVLPASDIPGAPARLAWSPDGECIAISLKAGDAAVVVYRLTSRTLRVAGEGRGTGITWLDDELVLCAVEGLTAAGEVETKLFRFSRIDWLHDSLWLEVPGRVSGIAVSPDGSYVAVARPDLDRIDVYDRDRELLGTAGLPGQGDADPFWSPDSGCLGVTRDSRIVLHDLFADEDGTAFDGWTGDWGRSVGGTTDDAPPVAAFTAAPEPAPAGEGVTFDATASTDDFGIVEYAWDFDGDGAFEASGPDATVVYVFADPGSYDVRLTVRDEAGQGDTSSRTVTVIETVTLTIEFPQQVESSVLVNVDGVDLPMCKVTCQVETRVGAVVTLTAAGEFYGWSGWDQKTGAMTCVLTMNADRTVVLFAPS